MSLNAVSKEFPGQDTPPRVLFSSYHCYLDSSSGAAGATEDLLQMLAARGWSTRVLCGPRLDHADARVPREIIKQAGLRFVDKRYDMLASPFSVLHVRRGRVPITVFQPDRRGAPNTEDVNSFVAIYERMLDTWRPGILLTYGGRWVGQRLIRAAKRRGIRVVFSLQNFAYSDAQLFDQVDEVLVPSQFAAAQYQQKLNLRCTTIPSPIVWDRARCEPDPTHRFVTFVNPQFEKGVTVFARIAAELGRLRPDIPLLVVEGRGGVDQFQCLNIRLDGLTNLHKMNNTQDPRDFYRLSKILLMPSLWNESFGRVSIEAMLNGIPVLCSDRGALAEVARDGGFVFSIPPKYTPQSRQVPRSDEVTAWVETIVRLWDDPSFYDLSSAQASENAARFNEDRIAEAHMVFLRRVASG